MVTASINPIQEDVWTSLAEHCKLVVPVYANEFVMLLQERYSHYAQTSFFFKIGEYMPGPLSIFLRDADFYGNQAPLIDLMCRCLEEQFGTGVFERYMEDAEVPEQDMALNILLACWDEMQEAIVHDMTLFFTHMQMVFLHPGTKITVNDPVKEVW